MRFQKFNDIVQTADEFAARHFAVWRYAGVGKIDEGSFRAALLYQLVDAHAANSPIDDPERHCLLSADAALCAFRIFEFGDAMAECFRWLRRELNSVTLRTRVKGIDVIYAET